MNREDKIDYYSESMAEEICSMPSFSAANIAVMIKARTKLLFTDILNDRVSELEDKRTSMLTEHADEHTTRFRKISLQKDLSKINVEIKKVNKVHNHLKISREYELLKKLCREKLPEEFMEDYYKQQKKSLDMEIHILDIIIYVAILVLLILYFEYVNTSIPDNFYTPIIVIYTILYAVAFSITPDWNWCDMPEIKFRL